jgi:hypothetical protein
MTTRLKLNGGVLLACVRGCDKPSTVPVEKDGQEKEEAKRGRG